MKRESQDPGAFKSWNEFYQRYILIFNLIVMVSLVPFGWMYLQLEHGLFQPYFDDSTVQWVGAAILIPMVSFGLFRSYQEAKKQILLIPTAESLRVKLYRYYKIQIRKFMRYELIAMIALAGMLIFQPVAFAIFYIFILFVFSLDWPKYIKVTQQLRLSKEEKELLEEDGDLPD